MSSKNILWGGLAAAVVYAGYRVWNLNKSIEFFQYSIGWPKIKPGIITTEITMPVTIYNPNKTGVPVNEFFGTLKNSSGVLLANFKSISPVKLGGNETSTVQVRSQVNTWASIVNLLKAGSLKEIQVDGIIKTGLFDMPVSKKITIDALAGFNQQRRNISSSRFLHYSNHKYIVSGSPN
jgi:LEA14-like dessication related protein